MMRAIGDRMRTDAAGKSRRLSGNRKSALPPSITDANYKTTTYAYDDADGLLSVTDAAGNSTDYGYDTENHLQAITDALGQVTSFAYDPLGRVTGVTFPPDLHREL